MDAKSKHQDVEFQGNNDCGDTVNLVSWFELMEILQKFGQNLYGSDTQNFEARSLRKQILFIGHQFICHQTFAYGPQAMVIEKRLLFVSFTNQMFGKA